MVACWGPAERSLIECKKHRKNKLLIESPNALEQSTFVVGFSSTYFASKLNLHTVNAINIQFADAYDHSADDKILQNKQARWQLWRRHVKLSSAAAKIHTVVASQWQFASVASGGNYSAKAQKFGGLLHQKWAQKKLLRRLRIEKQRMHGGGAMFRWPANPGFPGTGNLSQ